MQETDRGQEFVRTFGELPPDQQPLAGGKGGVLAQLYQAGYPVPEGFVILPAAFDGDALRPEAWVRVDGGRGVAEILHAPRRPGHPAPEEET